MASLKLTALELNPGTTTQLRPARRDRKWMDDTPVKYAYRCLPMVIANQFGWDVLSSHKIRATWDGTTLNEGIKIEFLHGDGPQLATSHFGSGILTFTIPFLFKTPEGWNLMVRGPTNSPKDGIVGLDGIVETDWSHATFTMNWKFTRACTVEFDVGEPIAMIYPVQRGLLETFEATIEPLTSDRELHVKYAEWSAGRDKFIVGLKEREEKVVKEGWEKDYFRASHETKVSVPEFRKK
jgi:hypothetical protein